MDVNDIKKIAVIGTGLMAHGIVQEFAQAGYKTFMFGRSIESLNRALANIKNNLDNLKSKGIISQEKISETLSNIQSSLKIEEIEKDTDVVIESVLEDLVLKQELFAKLESFCSATTILTSNTSSFPPSKLAEKLKRPERFVNTHYFNPPYLIPLVEIVKGEKTVEKYAQVLFDLYTKLGKKPVMLKKEFPGFIANRLQIAILREALYIVESGVADASDVDTVIKNSIGRRWAVAGVFEICELAGLDLFRKISSELQPTLNSSVNISGLLIDKVNAGELGIKSGKGFYDWTPELAAALKQKIADHLLNMHA